MIAMFHDFPMRGDGKFSCLRGPYLVKFENENDKTNNTLNVGRPHRRQTSKQVTITNSRTGL